MTSTTLTTPPASRDAHVYTVLILSAWFILITILSLEGLFLSPPGVPPINILLSVLISLSLFTLAYRTLPAFRAYVLRLDMRLLVMVHGLRMLGMGFVMLYMVDQLPMLFAFLAGFGDAITAIGAIVLAYIMLTRANAVSRKWISRWNMFGLMDFIVAVGIGILTRQGGILESTTGVNSDLMTQFPFAIIPAFLVQVFTLAHIIIFLQLRNN